MSREVLSKRERTTLYVEDRPGGRVVLKVLVAEEPTVAEVRRLNNEVTISERAQVAGVRRVIGRERVDGRHAIAMEHVDGAPLDTSGVRTRAQLADALATGAEIARVLADVHARGVVHKDVKPANVLVRGRDVVLIDFGIATIVERAVALAPTDRLEGTPAYMPPEQTGRVDRVVDARADLYSLGATLFEVLAGRLPFTSKDAAELIHAHLAVEAPMLDAVAPIVPRQVARVVARLLSKNPDERYASASGVASDLERCAKELRETAGVSDFALGARDVPRVLRVPDRVYGRDAEMRALTGAFERVAAGGVEVALLEGPSGSGKTALVRELRLRMADRAIVFGDGKFEELQRDVPYFGLAPALERCIEQLLVESESGVAAWRESLRGALGAAAPALYALVPALATLLGDGALEDAGADEVEQRFVHAARRLVATLASRDPLVLFVDDLQWADAASLRLLEAVLEQSGLARVLVIGAVRPEEAGAAHPVRLFVDAMRARGVKSTSVAVGDLGDADVAAIVRDTVGGGEDLAPLVDALYARTRGNPFFLRQYLASLVERGVLVLDEAAARWRVDATALAALPVAENVAEILTRKLDALDAASRDALRVASAIGHRFDVETLALATAQAPDAAFRALLAAVEHRLLAPLGSVQNATDLADGHVAARDVELRFTHDRVQQAAYALTPEAERRALHARIGKLLLERTPEDELDDRVFDILHHLEIAGDDDQVALLARAGQKALRSAAHARALDYFRRGIAALGGDAFASAHAIELHLGAARAAYLSGDAAVAEKACRAVIDHVREPADAREAWELLVLLADARNDFGAALREGLDGLRRLGFAFPAAPAGPRVGVALVRTKIALAGRDVDALDRLPEMTDARARAAMHLVERLIPAAFRSKSLLFPIFVFTLVQLTLKHGAMAVSSFGYATYAISLCGVLGDLDGGYRFGRLALKMLERPDAQAFRPKVLFVFNNFVRHWKEPLSASIEPLRDAYVSALETGNTFEAVWASFYRLMWQFQSGRDLASIAEQVDAHAELFARDEGAQHDAAILRQVVAHLTGTDDGVAIDGEHFSETKQRAAWDGGDRTTACVYHILKVQLGVLVGRGAEVAPHVAEAERHAEAVTAMPFVPVLAFYGALASTAAYRAGDRSAPWLRRAKRAAKKLARWAAHAPSNQLHRAHLVRAEIALCRDDPRARDHYDLAIEAARASGFVHEEGLVLEMAARFHAARGNALIAGSLRTAAQAAWREWGASRLVERAREAPRLEAGTLASSDATTTSGDAIDMAAVMRASAAISGEIVMDRLLAQLVAIIGQNAGAQRVALVLDTGGALRVEASADLSGESRAVVAEGTLDSVCEPVVRYVARVGEPMVVVDAQSDPALVRSAHVRDAGVRSILAVPLRRSGKVTGVVYLESSIAPGAFTPARVRWVEMLATQATISLENARLYDSLGAALKAQVRLTEAHHRFVPHEFLQSLERADISDVKLGDSVELEMAVLFSDMRGFASHVEGHSPRENIRFINTYLGYMEPAIVSCHGFVDSYIGDAIMALFPRGAPDAVAGAVGMMRALDDLNAARAKEGRRPVRIGVGINQGRLTLGTIGGENRIKCGVIGDCVNVAARVESLTKSLGVPLLVTGEVIDALPPAAGHLVRQVDRVRVAGRDATVTLYEVFDHEPPQTRDRKQSVAARYASALDAYFAGRFAEAIADFEACAAALPDDAVVARHLERARRHRASPPTAGWTGVESLAKV